MTEHLEEILMELEDLKRDSARLTWLIDEAYAGRQHLDAKVKREHARQYIDLRMATARITADVERARWCEEMKATVRFFAERQEWCVEWRDGGECNCFDRDRNIAIDKARGVK
jgi:hypothetical protein